MEKISWIAQSPFLFIINAHKRHKESTIKTGQKNPLTYARAVFFENNFAQKQFSWSVNSLLLLLRCPCRSWFGRIRRITNPSIFTTGIQHLIGLSWMVPYSLVSFWQGNNPKIWKTLNAGQKSWSMKKLVFLGVSWCLWDYRKDLNELSNIFCLWFLFYWSSIFWHFVPRIVYLTLDH